MRRVNAGREAAQYGGEGDDAREQLVDTITNLIHYADFSVLDFDEALRIARGHHSAESPAVRRARYETLCDYYLAEVGDGVAPDSGEPRRYAACCKDRDDELAANGRVTTWDTMAEAFADLADEVLNGMAIDAVYNLDTCERIEIHVSTPVVTRSEDQGMMVNPLDRTGADS